MDKGGNGKQEDDDDVGVVVAVVVHVGIQDSFLHFRSNLFP